METKIDGAEHYCTDCEKKTPFRWLEDEQGEWLPGEEPIYICCECGAEFEDRPAEQPGLDKP